MDNIYTVYIHFNKINNKRYIGITKQKPSERWGTDGRRYKKSNPFFYNAIIKYGWNSFEHIIYKTNLSKDDACNLEIELIKNIILKIKNSDIILKVEVPHLP